MGGKLPNMPKCHCLDRNATKRGERGVLDKTGGGRNICLHFPEPTAAASSSSSSHGRQQPAEKIDLRGDGKF